MESSKQESLNVSSAEVKQKILPKKHSNAYLEGKAALKRVKARLYI